MIPYSGTDNSRYTRTTTTNDYRDCTWSGTGTAAWTTNDNDIFTITYLMQPSSNGKKKRHFFDVMAEKRTWKYIQNEHTKVKVKTKRLGDFG